MKCAWKELLTIIPQRYRKEVDRIGRQSLQELRLRINAPPELVTGGERKWLDDTVNLDDLNFVVNTATKYSPWTAGSCSQGYITAPGGHRIGLCGYVVYQNGTLAGVRELRSVCIRVARNFSGIGEPISRYDGSVLIAGGPGSGKTTLLRDVICQISRRKHICVVDERKELFPEGTDYCPRVDVLSGCSKKQGIEMLLRTMGPECIAVDEITAEADCLALMQAANCGVQLIATTHAGNLSDFNMRSTYQILRDKRIFQITVLMKQDKTFIVERGMP